MSQTKSNLGQQEILDSEGYPTTHNLSKCKSTPPPPYPRDCKWNPLPEYYEDGTHRSKGWEQCTKNQWCSDCIIGYHKVCDNIEDWISKNFNKVVGLDPIAKNNFLAEVTNFIEQAKNAPDFKKLDEMNKNLDGLYEGYLICQKYRDNVYSLCFRNKDDPLAKTDKKHEDHNFKIETFKTEAKTKQNEVKSILKLIPKPLNVKSAKRAYVRSLKRKSAKRTVHLQPASSVVFVTNKTSKQKKNKSKRNISNSPKARLWTKNKK
jgi:hypothetical protein